MLPCSGPHQSHDPTRVPSLAARCPQSHIRHHRPRPQQDQNLPSIHGLHYAAFSDGFDDGVKPTNDPDHILSEFQRVGSQTLTELLSRLSDEGHPVTFLIFAVLLPWAADVARKFWIPSAFFCIQSATSFAVSHRYFNRDGGNNNPISVKLPGLPLFESEDLPSYLLPNSPHTSFIPIFLQHIQTLDQDPKPFMLVNSSDSLQSEAIRSIGNPNLIAVGPLIGSDYGCGLFEKSTEYTQWLDSKPQRSVIYVSFGTMVVLQRNQVEEILQGLIDTRRPFLWAIREVDDAVKNRVKEEGGLIVEWCLQTEVLSHESVGCFVSHCGWNSTIESMAAGVPIVGVPQVSDQTTNAKMVEEEWGNGVRVRGKGGAEEIQKAVEMAMQEEMKSKANKWRGLVMEATSEGGPSFNNLKAFVEP